MQAGAAASSFLIFNFYLFIEKLCFISCPRPSETWAT